MHTPQNTDEYTFIDWLNDGQTENNETNYLIKDTELYEIIDTIQEISHKNKKTEIKPIEIFLKIYTKTPYIEPIARNEHEVRFFKKYSIKEPQSITDIDKILKEYKEFDKHLATLEKTGAITKKNNEYIINHELLETLQNMEIYISANNQDKPTPNNEDTTIKTLEMFNLSPECQGNGFTS